MCEVFVFGELLAMPTVQALRASEEHAPHYALLEVRAPSFSSDDRTTIMAGVVVAAYRGVPSCHHGGASASRAAAAARLLAP